MADIKLRSADGVVVATKMNIVRMSGILDDMFKYCVPTEEAVIPLPAIKSDVLINVLNWLEHHCRHSTAPMPDAQLTAFDLGFFGSVKHTMLFNMLKAANYLDIQSLIYSTSRYVALTMSAKPPSTLRESFDLPPDFEMPTVGDPPYRSDRNNR